MLKIQNGQIEKCTCDKKPIMSVIKETALHVVLDGYGYVAHERIGCGQGFVTHKEEFAHYYPDPKEPWTYVWLRFSGEDTDDLFAEIGIPLHNGIFSIDNFAEFARVTAALFENGYYTKRNDRYCEAITKLLFALIAPKQAPTEHLPAPKRYVKEAKKFIDENYFYGINVTDVAKKVCVNRKYLCTLFAQQVGMSTMDYLLKTRMDRAKVLLERGDLSIGIVAASVGFDDPLCFSRIFKKHTGFSPRDYKNGKR